MKETVYASVVYEERTRGNSFSDFPSDDGHAGSFFGKEGWLIDGSRIAGVKEEIAGFQKRPLFESIHFAHYTCTTSQAREIRVGNAHPYISMVFSIKNNNICYSDSQLNLFGEIGHNQHNLLFIPPGHVHMRSVGEPGAELVVINLTLEYFNRFYAEGHPLFHPRAILFFTGWKNAWDRTKPAA